MDTFRKEYTELTDEQIAQRIAAITNPEAPTE